MVDYIQKLRDDLVEQFKDKPVIEALMEVVGDELNEVRQFYEDLRDKRNIQTAIGKQLDGIGGQGGLTPPGGLDTLRRHGVSAPP